MNLATSGYLQILFSEEADMAGSTIRRDYKRRDFIRDAAAASASVVLSRHAGGQNPPPGNLRVFVTSENRKHEELPAVAWSTQHSSFAADTLQIEASQQYQPMLGFGCAYTDAACFLLSGMQPSARQSFLEDTFSPGKMNLNVGRTSIGASDYSRDLYSYDDVTGDVEMKHFSIAHDEAYILPMLREMRRLNPELFLLSTPWSPPGWMKTYGSMLGGWMTSKYLAPYAAYFEHFLDAYREAGVSINAVTSQNELETDQGGSMPATYWTPEIESDFIRDHLGPLLRKSNSKTEIWLLDHNYNLWKRVRWQMQDPELQRYVSGVAWHGYLGTPDMMSRLHDTLPNLPFYWTEGGPDYTDPKYSYDWTRWGGIFSSAIRNGCRCLITWNLMLDEHGMPNIGPFSCGGLVTLRAGTTLEYSGQYWALRHFSQHVRRNAVRIATHSDASELSHVAFQNPDRSSVLVLTNTGDARTVRLVQDSYHGDLQLPSNSMTTVLW